MGVEYLKKVYVLYDEVIKDFNVVCSKGCAACCTCNVTLTRLEARLLLDGLSMERQQDLVDIIRKRFPEKRYIPATTLNGFAAMCMRRETPPEEENDPDWGRCPLLEDDRCSVYPLRPFACRSMLSETDCAIAGAAQIPERLLTINHVFMQFIEHMDRDGISGNLSDLLPFLLEKKNAVSGESGLFPYGAARFAERHLVFNQGIPALMVPADHQAGIRKIIDRLTRIQSGLNG